MEAKKEIRVEEKQGNITLKNRREAFITGVVEVIRFNEEQIRLNTNQGPLIIKGENLKMNKLDVHNGEVNIMGKIDSIVYTGSKRTNESLIAKLFK